MAITLFLASLAFLTASGIWIYSLYQQAFNANMQTVQTFQSIRAINRLMLSIDEAALKVSSFSNTRQTQYLEKLPEVIIAIEVNLKTVSQIISNNSLEISIFNNIIPLITKKIEFLKSTVSDSTHNFNSALKLAADSDRLILTNDINQMFSAIKKIEIAQLNQDLIDYQNAMDRANKMFIIFGTLNVIFLLIVFCLTRPLLDKEAK